MEKKQTPIIISRDLANVIKSFLVHPLKFVKITYDSGLKEKSINFSVIISIHISGKYINCIDDKSSYSFNNVIDPEKIEERVRKFMIKIKDGVYIRNLDDIKTIEKCKNNTFTLSFRPDTWRIYELTKSEASVLDFKV